MAVKRWLKGDTHYHSTNSDGKLPFDELVKKVQKRGLDFMIITDHNFYTINKPFYKDNLLVIPGWEYTCCEGHVNFWGSNLPEIPDKLSSRDIWRNSTFEEIKHEADKVRSAGGTVSVNHPFCKKCGWHLDLDDFEMHTIEVWNCPMHIDNMRNLDWWHSQLLKGRKLPAVGGSDYHEDYVVTQLIGCPTTYVYAEDNTEEAVLSAIRQGRSFITNSPKSTQLYLTCGEAAIGDEIEWKEGIRAKVSTIKLKKNHTLRVWNNDKIVFEHKAKKTGDFEATFEVKEKGFIRAEVMYNYGKIGNKIFSLIDCVLVPEDKGVPVPDLAWCFTNPIYFI